MKIDNITLEQKIIPKADSTTAVQIQKANGTTNVLNVDTTNSSLGIGTTSPAGILHTYGSPVSGYGVIVESGASAGAGLKLMRTTGTGTTGIIDVYFGSTRISQQESSTEGTNGGYYAWWTKIDGGALTEKMRILAGGNVGIGTTNPGYKLEVAGTARVNDAFTVGTGDVTDTISLVNNVGTYTLSGYTLQAPSSFLVKAGGTGYAKFGNSYGDLYIEGSGATQGFAGLGTVVPTAPLDIRGAMSYAGPYFATPIERVYSTNAAAVDYGGIIALGGESGNTTTPYSFGFITGAKETATAGSYAGYLAFRTTAGSGTSEANSGNYERMRITSTGNVGIGTTAPGQKLDVSNTIANIPSIRVIGSDTATFGLFQAGINKADGNAIGARMVLSDAGTGGKRWDIGSGNEVAGALVFRNNTDAVNAVTILSTGNVGIGTTTISNEKVKIVGASGGRILTLNAPTNGGYMTFESDATAYGDIGSGKGILGTGNATDLAIIARSGYPLLFGTNTEVMRIATTGNVGIGTTNPATYKLEVNGQIAVATGNGLRDLGYSTSLLQLGVSPIFGAHDSLIFKTNAGTEQMRILANGYVGIGTTAPGTKLDISASNPALTVRSSDAVGTTTGSLSLLFADNSSISLGIIRAGYDTDATDSTHYQDLSLIATQANGSIRFFPANTERMVIKDTGNVGIGQTSPTLGKLEVNGSTLTQLLVEANTAGVGSPNIIIAQESNSVYTNEGATALNYHTLPTAAVGLIFTFYVDDADGIHITANTGDIIQINGVVSSAAGYAESLTIGSSVTLVAINATDWVATSSIGTWNLA